MAQTASDQDADPVINVIEQDMPGGSGGATPASGRAEAIDASAMGAVSARRRREFDAARARLRDQAIREDAGVFRQAGARAATDAPADVDRVRAPLDEAPERVRKRYLRAGNQYFLKDAPYQLAFEDLGPYLVTEHNRPDVVESMVDMVHAKAWQRIRVSGHEAFRSEVWLQGTLLGIEVSGYQPKAADLARLAEARQARMDNRVEVVPDVVPATATGGTNPRGQVDERRAARPSPSSIPPAVVPVADMFPAAPGGDERGTSPRAADNTPASADEADMPRRYAGELREHGGAPYQHNPARSDSYYVVFRDGAGIDHVVWGVDLERAMRESGAQIGQPVTLENLGRRLVTVRVPILDGEGVVVGEEEKDVYRHSWQVDVVPRNREAARSTPQPARPDPDSARPADRSAEATVERTLQRRRSTPSKPVPDGEQTMHLAVLAVAMREQGFSERSISRVQQRATRMLESFGKEGIPVPVPKVFDPKAPSGRDRRARAVPEYAPAREIDRTPAEPSMPSR